mgnify:CR=1 FL=1
MKRKPVLWIFTELFYPDETSTAYILGEIALAAAEDHEVKVVTGPVGYSKELINSDIIHKLGSLQIDRVKIPSFNKDKLIGRLLRFIFLSVSMSFRFMKNVRRNDKVVIVTNPAPLMLTIAVLNRLRRARTYLIVHDVFPENLVAANLSKKNSLYAFIKWGYDKAYRSYDKILVLGRDMKEIILQKIGATNGEKVIIVENWGDDATIYPKATEKYNSFRDDRISFVFAGNIGRVQGLDRLVNSFAKFQDSITLTLIGNGAYRGALKAIVEEKQLSNIHFIDPLPRAEQVNFINSFDISIVSLDMKMYGLGVPSKTYNILVAGKPILYVGPEGSEIDRLIDDYKIIGWSVVNSNDLEKQLADIISSKASAFDQENIRKVGLNFSKEAIMKKYKAVLKA